MNCASCPLDDLASERPIRTMVGGYSMDKCRKKFGKPRESVLTGRQGIFLLRSLYMQAWLIGKGKTPSTERGQDGVGGLSSSEAAARPSL